MIIQLFQLAFACFTICLCVYFGYRFVNMLRWTLGNWGNYVSWAKCHLHCYVLYLPSHLPLNYCSPICVISVIRVDLLERTNL